MISHEVSGMPVIDTDGRLVGIVTEGDAEFSHDGRESRPEFRRILVKAYFDERAYRPNSTYLGQHVP